MTTATQLDVEGASLRLADHGFAVAGRALWSHLYRLTRDTEDIWSTRAVERAVPLSTLIATQSTVSRAGLRHHAAGRRPSGGWLPNVIIMNRRAYLWDGHHRGVLAVLRHQTELIGVVLDIKELQR